MANEQFDLTRRYVRITGTQKNGLVEFEYSVGEPEMVVELIMPHEAFKEFCATNQVVFIESPAENTDPGGIKTSDSEWNWNLQKATHQRFR
jgi:phenol hydroxylase P0 protein